MGKKFLIDTNIFIGFLLKRYSEKESRYLRTILDGGFFYSFITRIELLGFKKISINEEAASFEHTLLLSRRNDFRIYYSKYNFNKKNKSNKTS